MTRILAALVFTALAACGRDPAALFKQSSVGQALVPDSDSDTGSGKAQDQDVATFHGQLQLDKPCVVAALGNECLRVQTDETTPSGNLKYIYTPFEVVSAGVYRVWYGADQTGPSVVLRNRQRINLTAHIGPYGTDIIAFDSLTGE